MRRRVVCFFFFFNDTATTEIYTLSLHDALPISTCWCGRSRCRAKARPSRSRPRSAASTRCPRAARFRGRTDRKSTRLNSSHQIISYAVFCLKKKKTKTKESDKANVLEDPYDLTS